MFIKFSCIADDGLLGQGVLKQPALIFRWVTNKYTFLSMRAKSLTLILLDMYICSFS